MYLAPDVALQERLKRWSKILAVAVLMIALLVFAGWQLGIPILRRPLPNLMPMNPVAAICFIFLMTGFLFLTSVNSTNKTKGINILLVSIVLLVAIIKCSDVIFNLNIGIDQVLFKESLNEGLLGSAPSKMASNTAFCLVLSSFSLLFHVTYERRHKIYLSQYLSLIIALLGWLSILGYLYHERTFYGILIYIPMAIQTACCFFLFAMAMLFAQGNRGLMRELTSKFGGGVMARVLLPAVVLIPSVLGYFRMEGYRFGFYSNGFGTAILIIVIIIIFICIVWYGVSLLNRRDVQSRVAEQALRDSEKQVTAIFENAPDVVVVINNEGRITKWNPEAEKLFGWTQQEVINELLTDTIIPPQFRESHKKGIRRYLETGESTILGKSVELFAVKKDKTEVDVSLSISPMTLGGKQFFIGFIRDITEKKILENKLKLFNESLGQQVKNKTKELTDIFERVTDGFIALDTEYRVIYANKKIGEFTHRDPSTLIGKVIWDEFPDAIDSPTFYAFTKAMKEQQYQTNTDHNVPLDLWQENHIYPSPEGLSIFVKDISDRKRSEKAINEARDLADKLIDSLPGVFYFFDATGKFIRWNKQFEEVTGYSAEEISTMHPTDFFEGEEKEYITQRITGVFEKGINDAEASFVTKSGHKIPYYFKAVLLQYEGGPCLLGNGIDITERKKSEERLAMSEIRFRSIIEQFPYPVVIYNTDGDYVSTNESWEIMWQAKREDVKGYNIRKDPQMISSGLSVYVEKAFAGEVAISEPYEYDPTLIGQKGQKRWMVMTLYPLKNVAGIILEVVLVLQDVTDRKEAEDELRESEQKYKLLFENNPLPMWMLQLPGYNFIDVNNAALTQYGYTKDEFLELNVLDLRPNDEVEKFNATLNTNIRGVHHAGIWRHKKKDETILYVDIVTHDFIGEGDQPTRLVLANDITEKYIADEKLKESFHSIRELTEHLQKIREEERSHMAREIHDELGQLLTVLKMDVSWLNKKLAGETAEQPIKDKFKDLLDMIDTTVKTVRRLASELRPTLLDDLGLVAAIEWHLEEFERRSGIGKEFSSSVTELQIDDALKIGLFRIVQESLTNVARHSEAQKVNVDLEKKNGHIILKIADNGKGFDTQKMKKKTLGLLGMKERAGMMGGEYKIKSEPGQGTTVEVIVPVPNSDQ